MENLLKKAAEVISNANALIITSGAGMGVDSGLPDFRGNTGFWKEYPAISHLGISFQEMANPTWFDEKPKLAWAFYGHRYNLYRDTVPHKGFKMLLELGEKMKYGYFVLTSNVDGQFQKAGFFEDNIEEVHGSIRHFQCSVPCSSEIWDAGNPEININKQTFEAQEPLPKCKHCGAVARPNILMFGDWNWISKRSRKQGDNLYSKIDTLVNNNAKTVIIEMGAGKSVPTIRLKSQKLAASLGATLIRINPRDHEIPSRINGISIPLGALDGIEGIFKHLK